MRPASEQLAELSMNCAEIIPGDGLKALLEEGRPLRIKLGFDPTRPDLHIGHAVVLRKLKQFQDLGHTIIVIIGDFTAQIGDPTGKEETRPPLTKEEVAANAQTYCDQLWRILDQSRTEVRFNSEWLQGMSMVDAIQLMGKFTVRQMLERDNFEKRYNAGQPIGLHEFLYPLLQAYDSVAIRADVELGGTDQKFNLLRGRDLQPYHDLAPQTVLTMPILTGLDGKQKMSKSLDNYIGLTDAPQDMFGKMMSISDEQLDEFGRLAGYFADVFVKEKLVEIAAGNEHPMTFKKDIAQRVVSLYYSEIEAHEARQHWETAHQKRELPPVESMDPFDVAINGEAVTGAMLLADVTKYAGSRGEAKRLIEGGGVKLNEEKLTRPSEDLKEKLLAKPEGSVLQVGRRKFAFLKPVQG
jgi:tyrosyl-tRNA synthetase